LGVQNRKNITGNLIAQKPNRHITKGGMGYTGGVEERVVKEKIKRNSNMDRIKEEKLQRRGEQNMHRIRGVWWGVSEQKIMKKTCLKNGSKGL